MRKILGLVFFLIAALPAAGQGGFTTVTGTITDPNGLKYACGSISAQLITAGGASATLNGGGFTTQTSPVSLGCPTTAGTGAPGSFSMRLADSGVINPSNTTWKFTVNMTPGIAPPAGTGPQSFSVTTAINCGTNTPATCTSNQMDISTLLSASAPALSNSTGGGTATNGVGGTANPAAPVMATVYLANACLVANTGSCVFTPADTLQFNDCGWVVGTPATVTCATSHFVSTDCVGGTGCTGTGTSKKAMGAQTCAVDNYPDFHDDFSSSSFLDYAIMHLDGRRWNECLSNDHSNGSDIYDLCHIQFNFCRGSDSR